MGISVTLLLDDEHLGPAVELADGTKFPQSLEAWARVDDTPVTLWLVVEAGRPVLSSILIARPRDAEGGLEAATVQAIPVDRVVRQVVEEVARLMERVDTPAGSSGPAAGGRRVVTDDLLREVAAIVKADRLGKPNAAVVAKMHTSQRNASRWIAAAREADLLED